MRIKRGLSKHRKHKAVLEATKGFRMSYSTLYRRAKEGMMHAGQYAFAHRRKRQGQFRQTWIQRINAALTETDISYSAFIDKLAKSNIELNRKMLADIALNDTKVFAEIVKAVK